MKAQGNEGFDRRNFLKGAAFTAAGAAMAATLGGCAPKSESSGSDGKGGSASDEGYNTAATMDRQWSFMIPPEPIADDKIAETIEADLIVVGAVRPVL